MSPASLNSLTCLAASLTLGALVAQAAPALTLRVDAGAPGIAADPTLHGIFFEDINYAGDGGLYAELVQNRSFEDSVDRMYAWTEVARGGATGTQALATEAPIHPNNPHYLRLTVTSAGKGNGAAAGYGVANSGFDGIALKAGDEYFARVRARAVAGAFKGELYAILEDEGGQVLASACLGSPATTWQENETTLRPRKATARARLVLLAHGTGTVDVDVVSLFPQKTFRGRRNGMRADLAQALADMHPGFMRFPGGCIVEGHGLDNAYRWKDTIGDIAERKQNSDLWSESGEPHYQQTYGLGFYEFFQLAEDIGASPVPVVNCGMACQFRGGGCVPIGEIGPWVQDALDLVEFANGPATSEWGAKRAAMGHPAPFGMTHLAVGNEQWSQDYFDRYVIFQRALKEKYPDLLIISTAGPSPDDDRWRVAWQKFRSGTPADIVDEHYYVSPQWLYGHTDRYDNYDRKGPKVFVGEYAAHVASRANNLSSALAEAAYMTSLWQHADVVAMASYAPLFAKYGHVQWKPDLIWFDNSQVVVTPNYWAQAMFSRMIPKKVLPTTITGADNIEQPHFGGRFGVGTWATRAEYKDIRVTAADGRVLFSSDFSKGTDGWEPQRGDWSVRDGMLVQSSDDTDIKTLAGDSSWRDTTITLRARKVSGKEGFMIFFSAGDAGLANWNLGGWDNHQHGLDVPGEGLVRMDGSIETGRWYDIRIETKGDTVRCYLDGHLLQQGRLRPRTALYATAGVLPNGDYVVQAVNASGEAKSVLLDLSGATSLAKYGSMTELAGDPEAENTLDAPKTILPHTTRLKIPGSRMEHTFPAHSITTLVLRTKN